MGLTWDLLGTYLGGTYDCYTKKTYGTLLFNTFLHFVFIGTP